MFDPTSRYAGLSLFPVTLADGTPAMLVKPRIIPATAGVTSWRVTQGDRPDLVAHHFYQDGRRFWRIADANFVVDPAESYASPGTVIPIPTSKS